MLFPRKLQQPNTPKRIKRLPASPKALGLAAFSLVGLCFGSAVYLATMPGLIAQSPAVSVASEAGEKASDEANAAFEAAKETVKKSLSGVSIPVANAKEADSPAVEQPQQPEQKREDRQLQLIPLQLSMIAPLKTMMMLCQMNPRIPTLMRQRRRNGATITLLRTTNFLPWLKATTLV